MNDILNQFPLWFFICVIVFGAWCLFVYMLPGVWLWPLNHFFKLTAPLEDYNETSWRDAERDIRVDITEGWIYVHLGDIDVQTYWIEPFEESFRGEALVFLESTWDDALCDTPRAFQRSRPVNSSVTRTRSSSGWTRVEARRLPE